MPVIAHTSSAADLLIVPDVGPTRALAMTGDHVDGQATAVDNRYRPLVAVSEAIASHRDLSTLLHELAGRLRRVVRFDYFGLLAIRNLWDLGGDASQYVY